MKAWLVVLLAGCGVGTGDREVQADAGCSDIGSWRCGDPIANAPCDVGKALKFICHNGGDHIVLYRCKPRDNLFAWAWTEDGQCHIRADGGLGE